MTYPLQAWRGPLWRMLAIRYQREPWSGEGARLHGGRWNAPGQAALYLGTDHATAIAEYYQGLAKPGTLAPYRLDATAIADLTDGEGRATMMSPWPWLRPGNRLPRSKAAPRQAGRWRRR